MDHTEAVPAAATAALRVALYLRVSTEDQVNGFSLEGQEAALRDWCAKRGHLVAGVYIEEGKSGTSIARRPALQRLVAAAKSETFDTVLVWKVSRLARNLPDLVNLCKEFEGEGVGIVSVTEPFDTTTAIGRMNLYILGVFGEMERENIVSNSKLGSSQRARKGYWNGGEVLGYGTEPVVGAKAAEAKTRLVPIPHEAETVRWIFEQYAAGTGLRAIADALNRAGRRTKRGNAFVASTVAQILDNPLYIGQIRFCLRKGKGRRPRDPAGAPIVADGHHEPIIERALWDRARAERDRRRQGPRRASDRPLALSGILRCPQCGGGMSMNLSSYPRADGSRRHTLYYCCSTWRNKGPNHCRFNGVPAEKTEQAVLARLHEAVAHPRVLKTVVERLNARRQAGAHPARRQLAAVEAELARLGRVRAKYLRAFEDDQLDGATLATRLAELDAEAARHRASVEKLRPAAEGVAVEPIALEAVRGVLTAFQDALRHAPPERQRALLRALVEKVTLTDARDIGTVEVHLHAGLLELLGDPVPVGAGVEAMLELTADK